MSEHQTADSARPAPSRRQLLTAALGGVVGWLPKAVGRAAPVAAAESQKVYTTGA